MPLDPTRTAVGTWSGGRFMSFGQAIDDQRLLALLRPTDGIETLVTADVYGQGEADVMAGRAIAGLDRDAFSLVGAVGHDFVRGARAGAKGFPRFTDPALRGPDAYGAYLREATEASLARIGVDAFDLLLLHNPDRTGFEHPAVWEGMAALRDAGLTRLVGVAPGPANGFTLDVIGCLERFGETIDWAMLILNPFEPWPGELALDAARRHDVRVLARVVDYGGLFHGELRPEGPWAERDHRLFRPDGWVEAGLAKLERLRPIADRHGVTPLQLACLWDLAQPAVSCVAPTLIQEAGDNAKPIEAQRAELASLPSDVVLSTEELATIRELGDNRGSMHLKGASPEHEGEERPDRWPLSEHHRDIAARHGIDPQVELVKTA